MSKTSKPVWVVEINSHGRWAPTCWAGIAKQDASRLVREEVEYWFPGSETRIVKYIPAPVTPKAKPAPKAVSVLTDWISCDTPPVRVGVYERAFSSGLYFQYWNGEFWGWACDSAVVADSYAGSKSLNQGGCWRGFTTKQQ
jgi:hypothetical protein